MPISKRVHTVCIRVSRSVNRGGTFSVHGCELMKNFSPISFIIFKGRNDPTGKKSVTLNKLHF